MADYSPYVRKCVKLRGLLALRGLYDKPESLYERRGSFRLPDPGYLAAYGSPTVSSDILWAYRGGVEVAGVISACDLIDTTPNNPNQVVMVIGNCHYEDGPLMYITEFRSTPGILSRLFGPKAFSEYGTLKKLNVSKVPTSSRKKVAAWFEAIRAGDFQQLKSILGWTFSSRDQELRDLIGSDKFKWLSASIDPQKIQFFNNPNADAPSRDTYGCVCKIGSCDDQWPIVAADADDNTEWPYACATLYPSGEIAF